MKPPMIAGAESVVLPDMGTRHHVVRFPNGRGVSTHPHLVPGESPGALNRPDGTWDAVAVEFRSLDPVDGWALVGPHRFGLSDEELLALMTDVAAEPVPAHLEEPE